MTHIAPSVPAPGEGTAADAPLFERADVRAVFGVLVVGCATLIGLRALDDNSFLTHLATGELILSNGAVPRADPYAYTSGGVDWVVQSWFASFVYGLTDEVFGGLGLRVLTGALCGVIGWIAWRLTAAAESILVRAGALAATLVVGGVAWSERPLLIGLVGLGITVLLLYEDRTSWWVVPLYWLWVNTHGSYPLGLVVIALFLLGRRLDGGDLTTGLRLGRLALLGTLLGGLLNPYGPRLLLFPLEMLGRSDALSHIREWQSPDFSSLWTQVFLLLALAAFAGLMRHRSWQRALPLIVLFAAALVASRNIAPAAIVALPALAFGWSDLGVARFGGRGDDRSDRVEPAAVAVAAVLVAIAVLGLRGADFDLEEYPVTAVDWLVDSGLRGEDLHLAHPDTIGNYLTWRFGDDAQVFIDDRFEVHDDALITDYITLRDGSDGWRDVLARRDVDAVLWPSDLALVDLTTAELGWDIAHEDGDWTVVCAPGRCR